MIDTGDNYPSSGPEEFMNSPPKVWFLSVHFRDPFWVHTQRRFLDLYLDVPHKRVFAVRGISTEHFNKNEKVLDFSGKHAEGLDMLAEESLREAHDDDWLIFSDSDAFPITPISHTLAAAPSFMAVQRLENLGDPQPHPSFCASRAGLWRRIRPSWSRGLTWRNSAGQKVTDVGAGVKEALEETSTPWVKLHRQNERNLDSLWFGLYGLNSDGPIIYHHGAGSRKRLSRVNQWEKNQPLPTRVARRLRLLSDVVSLQRNQEGQRLPIRAGLLGPTAVAKEVQRAIMMDPFFWKMFT
jgi:hypothetical protein